MMHRDSLEPAAIRFTIYIRSPELKLASTEAFNFKLHGNDHVVLNLYCVPADSMNTVAVSLAVFLNAWCLLYAFHTAK